MEFELPLDLLKFTGMWPIDTSKSWINRLIKFRAVVSQLMFILVMVLVFGDWFTATEHSQDDYLSIIRSVFICLKEYVNFMFFYKNRKRIFDLVDACTVDFPELFANKENFAKQKKATEKRTKFLKIFGILFFVVWTLATIYITGLRLFISFTVSDEDRFYDENVPTHLRDRRYPLYFETWWKVDPTTSPTLYYILYVVQNHCVFHILWSIAATDNFVISVILMAKDHIDFLTDTAGCALRTSLVSSKLTMSSEQWLDYKVHVKKVVEKINSLLGGILYLAISNCMLCITIISYMGILSPFAITIKLFAVVSIFVFQIFIFSLVGQGVIRAGQKLCDEVNLHIRSQLVQGRLQDGAMNDSFQILLRESSEDMLPFIDVKGYYKLSLVLSLKILYSCFGYLTTLLQFREI